MNRDPRTTLLTQPAAAHVALRGAILVIEHDAALALGMRRFLERSGHEVQVAGDAQAGLAALDAFRPDAVVLDFDLPGTNGLEALAKVRAAEASAQVIVIASDGSADRAVDVLQAGAFDCLTQPIGFARLLALLDKAFGERRRDGALHYYRQREGRHADLGQLLGESAPICALRGAMRALLDAEAHDRGAELPAVLVQGETGTGKDLVARALHFEGSRRDWPFVTSRCAAMAPPQLESELFGHERGAFADARERRVGLVEHADGGTLFLADIGAMAAGAQAKLLDLLATGTLRRIGSARERRANVRVVAATRQPLEPLVRDGRFRADLYARLCVVQLHLPPLRERGHDLLLLARHFAGALAARLGKRAPRLTEAAELALTRHFWPGNVRELRNVVEQAVLIEATGVIGAEQLALSQPEPGPPAQMNLHQLERDALLRALEQARWNVSRAARLLGITRDTLRYRIDKYELANEMSRTFRGP